MAINFPTSPTTNVTTHTHNGVTYLWDGVSWVAQGSTVSYTLPIATASDLGGVKIGDRLTIDASTGVLDADVQSGGGGATTINNNADNRIITGSASANTLNAESSLTYDGNSLYFSDDKAIKFGSNLRMQMYTDGSINYIKSATDGGGAFPIEIHSGSSEVINIDDGNTQIKTGLKDKDGDLGTSGQILSSTGTQVNWIDAPSGGGGSPGGSANYIQYNDGSGGFGGDAKLRINTGSVVQTLEFWDAAATTTSSAAIGCYYEALAGNIPEKNELLFYGARTSNSAPALSIGTDYVHFRFKLKDASSSLGTVGQVLTVGSNGNVKWDTAGGAGSGLQSRTTAAATTSSLADQASGNLDITNVAKSFALLKIQTSHAAWVTLYTDTTSRSNDSTRNITTDPLPGSGVIAEVLLSDGGVQKITPGLIGYNDDATPVTTVYAKVQNRSGSATTVTVTLHFVQIES